MRINKHSPSSWFIIKNVGHWLPNIILSVFNSATNLAFQKRLKPNITRDCNCYGFEAPRCAYCKRAVQKIIFNYSVPRLARVLLQDQNLTSKIESKSKKQELWKIEIKIIAKWSWSCICSSLLFSFLRSVFQTIVSRWSTFGIEERIPY